MARVSYTTFDGEERTIRLPEQRPVRFGREPSNDVVLRDPKASRIHAQIVFEKGFFVVHDLDSANGTWIDGQRVRIAPLRDGAELRIGSTLIRFSEEMPELEGEGDGATAAAPLRGAVPREEDSQARHAENFDSEPSPRTSPPPPPPAAIDDAPQPSAPAAPSPPPPSANVVARPAAPSEARAQPALERPASAKWSAPVPDEPTRAIPLSQLPVNSPAATRPIELDPVEPDRKTTQRQSVPPVSRPVTFHAPPPPPPAPDEMRTERRPTGSTTAPSTGARGAASAPSLRRMANRQLFIDDFEPGPGESAIRNELDQPLAYFRGIRSATALVAGFVATMIIVTGLAVLAFLLYERAWSAAAAALLITVAFATMVGTAIPRRTVPIWDEPPPSRPALTLTQEPGLPLPRLRFAVVGADGAILAVVSKQVFPSLGRRVWTLSDASGMRELARATEDSLVRSLIGRIIGGSIRVLRTNYTITSPLQTLGTLHRAHGRPGRLLLDLSGDDGSIDRPLLLALALAIVTVER